MDRMYKHPAAMQVNQQLYLNLVHGWLSGHLLATIKDGVYSQNKPQLFTVALGEMFTHYEDRAFQRKRACIDWSTQKVHPEHYPERLSGLHKKYKIHLPRSPKLPKYRRRISAAADRAQRH